MKYRILGLSVALFFTSLAADENESGFEFAAGVGVYYLDDYRLKNAAMGVLNIGYRFDKNWQVEFMYGNPDTTYRPTNSDIDTDFSVLRGLYYFEQSEYFEPYVSAGIAATDIYEREDQVIAGLGIKMKLTDNLFWRIEGNFNPAESDSSLIVMLGYKFGGSSYIPPAKPKDSDGDGVYDNVDVCPNSPAGTIVDDTGCAIKIDLDTDMDGVFDHLDKCPNTPAKALVDASGCQKELEKEVSIKIHINFDSNKAVVKPKYFSEIEAVAKFMSEYAGTSVVIEGHTDSRGTAAHNQGLSIKRAEAVAQMLTKQFSIAASRVEAKGLGEDNPIADNETAEGRLANRRVVAVIKQQLKERQWK